MRATRFLAVLALSAAVLAGCGGGTSNAERLETISASSSETLQAKTARMTTTTKSTRGGAGGSGVNLSTSGLFDFTARAGSFTIDLGAVGAGEGSAEFRLIGSAIYFKAPPGAGMPKNAKPWLKIDLSDPALAQAGLSGFDQIANADPANSLNFLRGVSGKVEDEGTEKVRGVETTHYKATVDTEKAVAAADEKSRTLLQQTLDKGIKSVPTEVWIDADGRLRRIKQTVDLTKAKDEATKAAGVVTTTVELYDFGAEVVVEPPASGETMTLAEFQGLLSAP